MDDEPVNPRIERPIHPRVERRRRADRVVCTRKHNRHDTARSLQVSRKPA
jgi:hypothetical protein